VPYVMIKPKIMKAKQFMPEDLPWPKGVMASLNGGGYYLSRSTHPWHPTIRPGDWAIYEEKNRYVCIKEEFQARYEIVQDIEPR